MPAALIARSVLYAARGSAVRRRKVTISLGALRRRHRGGISCIVKFTGVASPREVVGEDSMQALALAMTYVQLRIRYLQDEGWEFYRNSRQRKTTDLLEIWFPHQAMPRWRSNTSLDPTRRSRSVQVRTPR